jgi:hypothetical protein
MAKRSKKYMERMEEASQLLAEAKAKNQVSPREQLVREFLSENEYEVEDAREVPSPYVLQAAPTLSPGNKRTPRCTKIAYSRGKEQLVVRFYDGTWWYYNNIDPDMWSDLRTSPSTGGWLHENGLNRWHDMGDFDPAEMTRENRVQFNAP